MIITKSVLIIFFLFYSTLLWSQNKASIQNIKPYERATAWRKTLIVPSLFLSAGILAATDNDTIDKFEGQEERNEWTPKFRAHIDDYLQYAPIAAVYGLNAFGLKGQHDFANRTALLIKFELIMMAIVLPLKQFTAVPRPDTGAPTSFPSGHTAEAFVAATFLHKEYGKDHPLISIAGYTIATSIGVLRVLNNRHWISDVITRAGIGTLSTNIAYLPHQNKWGKRKSPKFGNLTLAPSYSNGSYGLYAALRLK